MSVYIGWDEPEGLEHKTHTKAIERSSIISLLVKAINNMPNPDILDAIGCAF